MKCVIVTGRLRDIFKGKYRCTESIKFFQKRGISMLIIWGIAVFMGILTVVLLMGKGSFLIAGYNTSSKEEKQEYDEKKLCRTMGVSCYSWEASF